MQARKSMPNEPLTHLLRAQAAQLSGDKATARRIYESMLASTDTEQLGLRGLFLEAEREGEAEAATQFAERAIALNPQLSWPVDALFDLQCKSHDWPGALKTLTTARKNGHVEKASAERRRAVLLTAQAQDLEDKDPERSLNLSLDAHKLAPDLGACSGHRRAPVGLAWKHAESDQDRAEDLAEVAAPRSCNGVCLRPAWRQSARPPRPREETRAAQSAFARKRHCGGQCRHRSERLHDRASGSRAIDGEPPDAARLHADGAHRRRGARRQGRVREWLARAVNAPRDPAWTADGVVSEQWAAVSPVTGALDAFQWRVPVESMEKTADEIVARKLEELVALGAPVAVDVAVEAKDVTPAVVEQATGPVATQQATAQPETKQHEKPQAPETQKPVAAVADADVVVGNELNLGQPSRNSCCKGSDDCSPYPDNTADN